MNKKTKTILIITVVALLLVFGGITYAYFTANIAGSESNSTIVITGGRLEIRYDNLSNTITVENIYPRQQPWVVKNFTVTGTNTTDLKMNYKVGLEVVSNTFSSNELGATLENSNTAAEKEALDGTPIANTIKYVPASNTVWFGSGQFETTDPNEVHKYTLSIYYPETNTNQNANQQKAFTGKVVIEEDGTGELTDPGACTIQTATSYDVNYTACTNYLWNDYNYGSIFPASKQGLDSYEQDDYDYVDGACKNKETFETEIYNSYHLSELLDNGVIEDAIIGEKELVQGDKYVNGQYTYSYKQNYDFDAETGDSGWYSYSWPTNLDGWGVALTDRESTDPVTSELCTVINGKPIVSMENMLSYSYATSLDLGSFDLSNVSNMSNMFSNIHATSVDLTSFNANQIIASGILNEDNFSREIYITNEVYNALINQGYTSEDLESTIILDIR